MEKEIEIVPEKHYVGSYFRPPSHKIYGSPGQELLGIYAKSPDSGDYIHWFGCRESFHYKIGAVHKGTDHKRIFFETTESQKVIAFIDQAEKILNVKSEDKAKFCDTNSSKIISCYPNWWMENEARFSLFSILLRAGVKYNNKTRNFWTTAKKSKYLVKTWEIFRHFMEGNVHCSKRAYFNCGAWVSTFGVRNPSYFRPVTPVEKQIAKLKKRLIKRKRS